MVPAAQGLTAVFPEISRSEKVSRCIYKYIQ